MALRRAGLSSAASCAVASGAEPAESGSALLPVFFFLSLAGLVLGQGLSDEDFAEPALCCTAVVPALASRPVVAPGLVLVLGVPSEPVPDVVSVGDGVVDGVTLGVVDGVTLGVVDGVELGGGVRSLVGGDVLQFFPLEGLLDAPDDGTGDELRAATEPPDGLLFPEPGLVPVGEVEWEAGEAPELTLNAA